MPYQPVSVVEVRIWGQQVGAVSANRGQYEFQYSSAWRKTGVELSPLLMPTTDRRTRFSFTGLNRDTFLGLPPMLADALPDKFGNAIIDAWLSTEGVRRDQITPLDRLAYLGSRGMGALEFVPGRDRAVLRSSALDLSELVGAARDVIAGTIGSEAEATDALRQIVTVGTSAGGARAKAVVNINEVTGEIRPGQTMPGLDEQSWLLKLDGVGPDRQLGDSEQYTRIEYAYSLMARASGIEMSDTRLLIENERAHFLTRRFDRDGGQRIHLQSLCGIAAVDFNLRETNDYSQLFDAAIRLQLGESSIVEIFRRMVFNVAASNHDDHSKNHSFLLRQGGGWELSPAYDVTFARDSDSVWLNRHLMSVNGLFIDITRSDLLAVADRFAVPGAKRVISDVADALDSWPAFADDAGLPRAVIDQVRRSFVEIRA